MVTSSWDGGGSFLLAVKIKVRWLKTTPPHTHTGVPSSPLQTLNSSKEALFAGMLLLAFRSRVSSGKHMELLSSGPLQLLLTGWAVPEFHRSVDRVGGDRQISPSVCDRL